MVPWRSEALWVQPGVAAAETTLSLRLPAYAAGPLTTVQPLVETAAAAAAAAAAAVVAVAALQWKHWPSRLLARPPARRSSFAVPPSLP